MEPSIVSDSSWNTLKREMSDLLLAGTLIDLR